MGGERSRAALDDEERGWEQLTEAFGRIGAERFEDPRLTADGWSPKDVMYHVAAWSEEAARVLGRMTAGTHRDRPVDVERLNHEWFGVSRGMDPAIVRVRFAKARTSMRDAFAQIDEPDAAAREWFEESGAHHYREHLEGLRTVADG